MTPQEIDRLIADVTATVPWTKTSCPKEGGKIETYTASCAGFTISLSRLTLHNLSVCYGVVVKNGGGRLRVMHTETATRLVGVAEAALGSDRINAATGTT